MCGLVCGVELLNHSSRGVHVLQIRRNDIVVAVFGPSGKRIDKTIKEALQSLERPLTVAVHRKRPLPVKCAAFSDTPRGRPLSEMKLTKERLGSPRGECARERASL